MYAFIAATIPIALLGLFLWFFWGARWFARRTGMIRPPVPPTKEQADWDGLSAREKLARVGAEYRAENVPTSAEYRSRHGGDPEPG
jgi:hypothetical protein